MCTRLDVLRRNNSGCGGTLLPVRLAAEQTRVMDTSGSSCEFLEEWSGSHNGAWNFEGGSRGGEYCVESEITRRKNSYFMLLTKDRIVVPLRISTYLCCMWVYDFLLEYYTPMFLYHIEAVICFCTERYYFTLTLVDCYIYIYIYMECSQPRTGFRQKPLFRLWVLLCCFLCFTFVTCLNFFKSMHHSEASILGVFFFVKFKLSAP